MISALEQYLLLLGMITLRVCRGTDTLLTQSQMQLLRMLLQTRTFVDFGNYLKCSPLALSGYVSRDLHMKSHF
jgi:hypothetical protein